jgi:hypothetical protein
MDLFYALPKASTKKYEPHMPGFYDGPIDYSFQVNRTFSLLQRHQPKQQITNLIIPVTKNHPIYASDVL